MTTDCELEVRYRTGLGVEEDLEALLYANGSIGSYVEETREGTVAHFFFDDEAQRSEGLVALQRQLPFVAASPVDRQRKDWLGLYQQSLRAIEVGKRFVVAPEAQLIEPSDRISLVIPQERAFGTGSHETTALCLEVLEGIDVRSRRCLDVGTGSGILAIALSLLGAEDVVAFDHDTEILGVLARNAERNGVNARAFRHFVGSIESVQVKPPFGLVVMNIVKEVIVPLLADVKTRMSRDGLLILSGVLLTASAEVVSAARESSFRVIEERSAGEWWCGLLRKES